jgi:hypothetical protein
MSDLIERARRVTAETEEEFYECSRRVGLAPAALAAAILRDQEEWSDPVEGETAPAEAAWRRSPGDVMGAPWKPGERVETPRLPGERRIETSERSHGGTTWRRRDPRRGQLPGAHTLADGSVLFTLAC